MMCFKLTTKSPLGAFSQGRMSLAFLTLPVWLCSVNCYEPLLKQVRALPSVSFCTLLQLQLLCLAGEMVFTAAHAPGVQHAQVLLRALPVLTVQSLLCKVQALKISLELLYLW